MKEGEPGQTCGTNKYWRTESSFIRNLEEGDHLKGISLDGRMTL